MANKKFQFQNWKNKQTKYREFELIFGPLWGKKHQVRPRYIKKTSKKKFEKYEKFYQYIKRINSQLVVKFKNEIVKVSEIEKEQGVVHQTVPEA